MCSNVTLHSIHSKETFWSAVLWQSIVCRHCTARLYCSAMAVLCKCKALCYGGKGVTRHISLLQGSLWNGFYPPWDITWILQTTIAPIILSDAIAYNVNKKRWQTKISRTKTACGQWCVRQSTIYRTGHYHPILGDKGTGDDSTSTWRSMFPHKPQHIIKWKDAGG